MSRSLKKGVYIDAKLLEKVKKVKASGSLGQVIKTWSRVSVISPEMVGLTFGVHNGHAHVNVSVIESMVGHRFGEFAPTRIFKKHSKKGLKSSVSEGRV